MFRLRRWYNQNSKTIWKVAGIVVFLIIILQVLNYFAGKNNSIKYNSNTVILPNKEYTDLSISADKSVLTNEKITDTQKDTIEVINDFFAYCNAGKIEEAYNLLTEECKEEMYPKLNNFKESYYNKIFNGEKKNISLENWIGNIYKVNISNDLLSTGMYDETNIRQEYITIKESKNKIYKLNINNYISREDINKSELFYDNVELNVEEKDIYMDYEIYTFTIKNNTDNTILIDNLKNIDSMYIEDKNSMKYSAYTHEISLSELLIKPRETREFKVKYYNKYGSNKKIKNVVFSRVIMKYTSELTLQDYYNFNEYCEFKIGI